MSDGEQQGEDGQPTDEDGNVLAPDGATVEEIEAERAERLDPDNRPDGAEIDNTQRTFNEETGMFEDSRGAEDAEPRYAAPASDD
ncbi:hypothetical protein GCM10009737_24110 [Nocardioides lentus]|uniref:Uncharacterized protein n=1 Tax=Nocardioides lentus TaxID=338077 RepID=A0ABN2PKX5_9ACTN